VNLTLTGVGRVLAAAQLLAQPVCAACLEVPPFPYLLLLLALPLSLHCGQPSAPLLCPLLTCPSPTAAFGLLSPPTPSHSGPRLTPTAAQSTVLMPLPTVLLTFTNCPTAPPTTASPHQSV